MIINKYIHSITPTLTWEQDPIIMKCQYYTPVISNHLSLIQTFTSVQHDFYSRWCSCHLTVIRWATLVEQELLTLLGHQSSPGFSGMYDDGQLVQQELLTLLGYQSSPQVLVRIVTMGNTSGAGTANPSGAPEFTSGFSGVCDDGQH